MWSSNTVREANSGHSSDQRIDGKIGTYGRDDKYIQDFGSETRGKGTTLDSLAVGKNNIKMDLQERCMD